MKKLLTIFCLVLLSSYSYSQEVFVFPWDRVMVDQEEFFEIYSEFFPFEGPFEIYIKDVTKDKPKLMKKIRLVDKKRNNGILRGNFKDGKKEGVFELIVGDVVLLRSNYRNDKLHGLNETFYSIGTLFSMGNFIDDKLDGLWGFYTYTGRLIFSGIIKNDNFNGLFKSYSLTGSLIFSGNFKDSIPDGLWEMFHENGQLREMGNFTNGKQDGLFEYFDEDGNLTNTEEYKDGELIE